MSHYDDLTEEQRIKMARDAVKYRVPIAPRIRLWLSENGLLDQITNPRRINNADASTATSNPAGAG